MWGSRPGNAVRLAITGPVQWGVVTNIPQGPWQLTSGSVSCILGAVVSLCAVGFSIG